MIRKIVFIILSCFMTMGFAQIYPSANVNLIGQLNPEPGNFSGKYSGCWGWFQASKNREYALIQGTSGNLFFVDISSPTSPTVCDVVQGGSGMNREVQTYNNYCYSVSGNGGSNAVLQIIDMSYLPDSVHVVHSGTSIFKTAHTIFVEGNKLYASSVTYSISSGQPPYFNLNVYSLATPSAPILLRTLSQDYSMISGVHDVYVRRDTVYASCMDQGLHVYRFNSQNNTFNELGSLTNYPESGFNHSSSLTNNGKTLIMCDEVPSALSIKAVDVSNLSNMTPVSLFKPNNFADFVAHNPYIKGDQWAYISCYQDGLMIYNIADPQNPVLAGYFDTYPQGGANTGTYGATPFEGNWGVYPYLPSGLIIALDMTNGLFILQTVPNIGVKEVTNGSIKKVNLFPVPVSADLQIEFDSDKGGIVTGALLNCLGQEVYRYTSPCYSKQKFSTTIDLSEFDNGFYIHRMELNGEITETKIVVSK